MGLVGCRGGFRFSGNVEDIELATGGGLGGMILGRIVRDVIAVDDVIVPISRALFQRIPLEFERSHPAPALSRVL